MNEVRTSGPLLFTEPDCPTRVGEVINTLSEIYDIPMPRLGMRVFVKDEGLSYIITGLKDKTIEGVVVPDAQVDKYESIGAKDVAWDSSSNLNDFISAGVYNIKGTRQNAADNLPITNTGENATIAARLIVTVTPQGATTYRHSVGQTLILSNAEGKETKIYTRNGNRTSYDGGISYTIEWSAWATQQTNINVGQVDNLDNLKDNGIYSGVWTKGSYNTYPLTFVCIVINDYFVGVSPRRISQFVYGLSKMDGSVVYQSRVWDDSKSAWGDWEILNKNQIARMIGDEIRPVNETIETITENLVAMIEGEAKSRNNSDVDIKSKAVHYSLYAMSFGDKVNIGGKSVDGNNTVSVDIPAATENAAGVMSANDKQKLEASAESFEFFAEEERVGLEISANSGNLSEAYIPAATTEEAGVMSAEDKKNLDNSVLKISDLEETAIVKTAERTANLFNYKDKTHKGQTMSDNGTWATNTAFDTAVIPLEKGKSYTKYQYQDGGFRKSTWGNVYVRVFYGDSFQFKTNTDAEITIPSDAVNPIGYFGYYNSNEDFNPELLMVLPDGVPGDKYIPYLDYTITDETLNSVIDDKIEKAHPKKFAERPAEGYENFFVDVDCNIANNTSITDGRQDNKNIKKDRCVLTLPVSYTSNGKPTRLVICGHGTGYKYTAATTSPNAGMNIPLLLGEGYALLGCNGTPGELDGLDLGHNCVPECYRSILAAYRYVIDKYNICTDGVFTVGYSMGTYMTGQIALFKDIPVLAQVFYGFSGEIWKAQFSLKPAVRQRMCEKFGFTGADLIPGFAFTSEDIPSPEEQTYIKNNLDKWSGYNLLIAGLTNKAILSTYDVWVAAGVINLTEEAEIYNDAIVVGRPPCKFFVCDDDTTSPKRWSEYMVKMIRNGGGYAELRHYPSGGHETPYQGSWINYTTKYGGEVNISGASYEGLLFLQRFGQ